VVIGKKGEDIDALRPRSPGAWASRAISIEEIRKPELDAQLVARGSPSSSSAASCFAGR